MLAINFAAAPDGATALAELAADIARAWEIGAANGTAAGVPARAWSDARTLDDGAGLTLDLAGPGDAPLASVKGLILYAYPSNATVLTVSGGVATPLQPGELVVKLTPGSAGYPPEPLTVANAAGGAAQFGIIVIGA